MNKLHQVAFVLVYLFVILGSIKAMATLEFANCTIYGTLLFILGHISDGVWAKE